MFCLLGIRISFNLFLLYTQQNYFVYIFCIPVNKVRCDTNINGLESWIQQCLEERIYRYTKACTVLFIWNPHNCVKYWDLVCSKHPYFLILNLLFSLLQIQLITGRLDELLGWAAVLHRVLLRVSRCFVHPRWVDGFSPSWPRSEIIDYIDNLPVLFVFNLFNILNDDICMHTYCQTLFIVQWFLC